MGDRKNWWTLTLADQVAIVGGSPLSSVVVVQPEQRQTTAQHTVVTFFSPGDVVLGQLYELATGAGMKYLGQAHNWANKAASYTPITVGLYDNADEPAREIIARAQPYLVRETASAEEKKNGGNEPAASEGREAAEGNTVANLTQEPEGDGDHS
jgi:hypothetical protein